MFHHKILCLLILSAVPTRSYNLNATIYSEDFHALTNPHTLAKHILSLEPKNGTRFISSRCLNHLFEYAKALLNLELWAIEFFDSSEKLPSGLLKGYGAGLGSYDQCLALKHEASDGTIKGKYCLGTFGIADFKAPSSPHSRLLNLIDSEVSIPWGVCLPDSCSAEDFKFVTLTLFKYSEGFCQTTESETKQLDAGDYTAIALLTFISAIVILSTIIHARSKNKDAANIFYFSLITSAASITEKKDGEDEITCLHGLRAITLIFMTMSFKFLMYPLSVLTNWLDILSWILDRYSATVLEAMVCIDTFFVISGMLISYKYLNNKHKGAKFNLLLYYLNRIIRLTPALAFMVLFCTTLLRHYGSGPIWPYIRSLFIVDSCQKHWWSSLLYVQNYVNPGFTDICILQTWFLSVEMQLFILSPLLLIPLGKMPKYTLGGVAFLLLCSVVSPFIVTWVYQLQAHMVNNMNPVELDRFMKYYYFPLHTRASSWLIGFVLGYILFESKKESNRSLLKRIFSPLVVILLWVLSMGLIVTCLLLSQVFINKEYSWLPNAFHLALVKPIWSLSISWIIFACIHGYSGPVNGILSSRLSRIISGISYSTFLVNFTVIFALNQQTRRGWTFSIFSIVSTMWADLVWSLIFGFVLSVTFEKPFINLFKSICKRFDRTSPKNGHIQREFKEDGLKGPSA